jgi:hypothetical protein
MLVAVAVAVVVAAVSVVASVVASVAAFVAASAGAVMASVVAAIVAVVWVAGLVVRSLRVAVLLQPAVDSSTPPLPLDHVDAIGVRRPGYGNAGRYTKLVANHVEVELKQGMIYHYDGMCLSHLPAKTCDLRTFFVC